MAACLPTRFPSATQSALADFWAIESRWKGCVSIDRAAERAAERMENDLLVAMRDTAEFIMSSIIT